CEDIDKALDMGGDINGGWDFIEDEKSGLESFAIPFLSLYVSRNRIDLVTHAIKKGANIGIRDSSGSPIIFYTKSIEMFDFLLPITGIDGLNNANNNITF